MNRNENQTLRVKIGIVMAGTFGLQLYLNEHTGAIRPYSVFLHEDALCLPGLSNDNLHWLLLDDLDVKNDMEMVKKKTILVINDNLPTNVNGVVTFLKNMEKYAVDENYSVKYLYPSQFPHFDCPGYPDIKLSIPLQLASKIRAANPDFIHIATEGPLGLATRLYCDRHGIPYNSAYHTRIPEYMNVQFGIPEAIGYGYLRWFHSNSRQVLTTTDTMVSELESRGFIAPINPMKFGVDRSIFSPKLRQEKAPSSCPVLLSVGRVSKEKGLDAFCELKYPGATKIVVGDGAYRKELEERYPDIHFVGYQSGKLLAEYFANADCLVFTSRTDTFGLVMIESMACGTPVAAFPVTGPLDVIENGVTGYLSNDLKQAIEMSLCLDRTKVENASQCWSWESCWSIFQNNLVPTKEKPESRG
ncbi:glycosyltransferase [Thraustotheca clavata]|uniref:Glycosyltransferase n=1 Tax=Thraustotheca clavata TaxID=74557 RepID=A0A1W0ACH7_9STRA|nr:glycosyltransferase [Thraustotheca clavata]